MIINFFQSLFLSTIDCFKIFPYNKVITIIQSLNLLNRIFIFEKDSIVVNVDILDKNEKLLAHIIPTTNRC